MKVVAYYRSSTDLQENSVEMQRQSVLKYLIKQAVPIDEEFIDEAVSARKLTMDKRPALKKLLADIRNDKIDKLVVYKRDRLARKADEYMKIYKLFKDKNLDVTFTAENEPPLNFSPIGEFFELLMAGVVQREAEQIVERIQQTIKAKFEEGINFGPGIPYGYKKSKGEVVSIPEELDVVSYIFESVLSGKYQSLAEIRQLLNEKGFKYKGKDWTVPSIRKVLSEPTYMGVRNMTIAGEKIESAHYDELSIISKDKWIETQKVLNKIDNPKHNAILKDVNFPLIDLLVCSHCQNPLSGNKARTYENLKYFCKDHKQVSVPKALIENKLLQLSHQFFQKLLASNLDQLFKSFYRNYTKTITDEVKLIENQIDMLNKKLIKKTEKWFHEKNPDQKAMYEQSVQKLYDNIKEEEQRKTNVLEELNQFKQLPEKIKEQKQQVSMLSSLKNLNETDLVELYRDIISAVIVSEHSLQVIFKHPYLEVKEGLSVETI